MDMWIWIEKLVAVRYDSNEMCLDMELPSNLYIEGFVPDCSISIADALEIPQSCT